GSVIMYSRWISDHRRRPASPSIAVAGTRGGLCFGLSGASARAGERIGVTVFTSLQLLSSFKIRFDFLFSTDSISRALCQLRALQSSVTKDATAPGDLFGSTQGKYRSTNAPTHQKPFPPA